MYSLTSRLQLVVFCDVCATAVFLASLNSAGPRPTMTRVADFGQKLSFLFFFWFFWIYCLVWPQWCGFEDQNSFNLTGFLMGCHEVLNLSFIHPNLVMFSNFWTILNKNGHCAAVCPYYLARRPPRAICDLSTSLRPKYSLQYLKNGKEYSKMVIPQNFVLFFNLFDN